MTIHPWYRLDDSGQRLTLTLHIQPGARVTSVAGLHGGALKIKIAAPPAEGKANAALAAFLSKAFNVPLRQIKVVEIEHPNNPPESLLA
jgi:uncharacterized protein (TIGR00251 family)